MIRCTWQGQIERLDEDHARWVELLDLVSDRVEQGEMRLAAQQERLPMAEDAYASAQEEINEQRAGLAQANQQLQVELTHRSHAQRSLQIIAGRRDRLAQEREALPVPDHTV